MWKQQPSQNQVKLICNSECVSNIVRDHVGVVGILAFQTTSMIGLSYIMVVQGGLFGTMAVIKIGVVMGVCYLWSARFCKVMLNPIFVMMDIVRKDTAMTLKTGCIYFICELVGAIIGSLIGYLVIDYNSLVIPLLEQKLVNSQIIAICFQSFLSSFILCFIVLIITSKDTTFVQIQTQICLIVPIIYSLLAIQERNTIGSNPVLTIIIPLFGCYFSSNWNIFLQIWPLILTPFVGSIASIYFFNYVFHPLFINHKQQLMSQSKPINGSSKSSQKQHSLVMQMI